MAITLHQGQKASKETANQESRPRRIQRWGKEKQHTMMVTTMPTSLAPNAKTDAS